MVSWFCEVGGTMRALRIVPVCIDLVAVEQQPPRGFGGTRARRPPAAGPATRRLGRLVGLDQRSASSQAKTSSTARTTMLRKGLLQTGPRPAPRRRLRGEVGGSCRLVERVAGQRAGEVRVAPAQAGVQRGRARDVLFDDELGELGRSSTSSPSEDADPPARSGSVRRRASATKR